MSADIHCKWAEQPLAVIVGVGDLGTAIARRPGQHYRLLLTDLNATRLETIATMLRKLILKQRVIGKS